MKLTVCCASGRRTWKLPIPLSLGAHIMAHTLSEKRGARHAIATQIKKSLRAYKQAHVGFCLLEVCSKGGTIVLLYL